MAAEAGPDSFFMVYPDLLPLWFLGPSSLRGVREGSPFVLSALAAVYDELQVAFNKLECLGDPQVASNASALGRLSTSSHSAIAKRVRHQAWCYVTGTSRRQLDPRFLPGAPRTWGVLGLRTSSYSFFLAVLQ